MSKPEDYMEPNTKTFREVRAFNNEFANWYGPRDTAAGKRLNKGKINFEFEPKFKLKKGASVFTIGSCFARNVEKSLLAAGCDVPAARDCAIDYDLLARVPKQDVLGNGYLNKYNTHSMLSHLKIALSDPDDFPELVEVDNSRYYSTLTHNIRTMAYEEAIQFASYVRSIIQRVKDCDVVVITLGLNEVWYDSEKLVFVNGGPLPAIIKRNPERFGMFRAGVAKTVKVLEEIHSILKTYCGKEIRIIVTVSPVPMGKTFSDKDIISANSYSKSVLRVAAEEFTESDENRQYFPSYEIAMYSDPKEVWQADRGHVKSEFVSHIISNFCELFFSE